MKKNFLSFIVPTYNRKSLVSDTLNSILNANFDVSFEVIIIDDHSNDGTMDFIYSKYQQELKFGLFKYFYLEKNIGVTGAKNYGAFLAEGEWLVFLDSDDLFIIESKNEFLKELINNEHCGAIFFRCITFDGKLIGEKYSKTIYYDLNRYLNVGFPGECLPVIKKDVFVKFPYEEELKGFEHLSYIRILKNNFVICVSTTVARKYRTENKDRLSTFKGKLKRSIQFYMGYKKVLSEYKLIGYKVPIGLYVRITFYRIISTFRIFNIKKRN